MKRRDFIATGMAAGLSMTAGGLLSSAARAQAGAGHGKKMNFLVIMTDDQGYGDLGCMGHPAIQTPNLDRLASESCLCTDFYTPAPICAPTRAALVTGRNPNRFGLKFLCHNGQYDAPVFHHVPLDEPMLPRQLKQAGYRTGHVGKWHLSIAGYPGNPLPDDYGYDHYLIQPGKGRNMYKDPMNYNRNGEVVEGVLADWSERLFADEAIRFIDDCGDTPFFLNLWPFTPHEDIIVPERYRELYAGRTEEEKTYFGSITFMDEQVGRLLAHLDESGLRENTVVIFASDNGPADPRKRWVNNSAGSSGPFRGQKGTLYEGGIRVPGIIRWPGLTRPGSTIHEPISMLDFFPTFLAAAGVALPQTHVFDGADFRPALAGKPVPRHQDLYWQFDLARSEYQSPTHALRRGRWKLLYDPGQETPVELYNLDIDRGEKWNLAEQHPEIAQPMLETLLKIKHESIEPDSRDAEFLSPEMPPPSRENLILG